MSYPAEAVANEFLKLAKEDNINLNHMKIQKLVYLAHGFYLAFMDEELLNEYIEAWEYGPVIRSLYNELKYERNDNIDRPLFFRNTISKINEDDIDTIEVIAAVWNEYKGRSAKVLSYIAFMKGTPWHKTYGKQDCIDNFTIRKHFKTKLKG